MDEKAALRTVAHAIRHRSYVLVAIVAAFTLGAGLFALIRPPVYQGTALLFVDERHNSSQGFDLALQAGELLSAHFIQAATSQPVLARACSGAYFNGSDAPGVSCTTTTLGPRVSANTVRGTAYIGVSVTARSPAESAALANAVAGSMLDQNKADIDQLLAPTRDYLQSELKRLSTAIAAEQATISKLQAQTPPGQPAPIASDQAQLALLQSQYAATYARSQDLVIEQNRLTGSLTLVQAALAPAKPIDPDPFRYLAVGLVAGLCLGLAAALLIDRLDDRLFETDALALAAGTRLVVSVSQKESASGSPRSSQVYAVARANLLAQYPNLRKVLIVAASERDRVRPVAAGLGMAAVKAGQRVLVVDAGANSYVMQRQGGKSGALMTIVSAPNNGEAGVDDEALADRDGKYELTVTSAPSPDHDPTAVLAAHRADIAIIVATARSTRFSDVRRTAETLRLAGIQVAASVFAVGRADEPRPESEAAPTDLLEVAVNQWRLPTWRGPGGS